MINPGLQPSAAFYIEKKMIGFYMKYDTELKSVKIGRFPV